MSNFVRYQSLKRYGTQETEGIEKGKCYIFPKLDGTNASVWFENGAIQAGSRNRLLTAEGQSDNAGFRGWALESQELKNFFAVHSGLRLYGEWLVPHTIKQYRESAWRQFYVFDVVNESGEYVSYDEYQPLLVEFGIKCIEPMAIGVKPTKEQLMHLMEKNTYLMADGSGAGEGIVIKNYEYVNRYGRVTWAKMVRNEFKENARRTHGVDKLAPKYSIEEQIINKFATEAFLEKELAKILLNEEWSKKLIPQFLGRSWYEFLCEETPNFVKHFKGPQVDFSVLNHLFMNKAKEVLKAQGYL